MFITSLAWVSSFMMEDAKGAERRSERRVRCQSPRGTARRLRRRESSREAGHRFRFYWWWGYALLLRSRSGVLGAAARGPCTEDMLDDFADAYTTASVCTPDMPAAWLESAACTDSQYLVPRPRHVSLETDCQAWTVGGVLEEGWMVRAGFMSSSSRPTYDDWFVCGLIDPREVDVVMTQKTGCSAAGLFPICSNRSCFPEDYYGCSCLAEFLPLRYRGGDGHGVGFPLGTRTSCLADSVGLGKFDSSNLDFGDDSIATTVSHDGQLDANRRVEWMLYIGLDEQQSSRKTVMLETIASWFSTVAPQDATKGASPLNNDHLLMLGDFGGYRSLGMNMGLSSQFDVNLAQTFYRDEFASAETLAYAHMDQRTLANPQPDYLWGTPAAQVCWGIRSYNHLPTGWDTQKELWGNVLFFGIVITIVACGAFYAHRWGKKGYESVGHISQHRGEGALPGSLELDPAAGGYA